MKPLFSFGTLMDADILATVSGQPLSALHCEAAGVSGYAQREVVGQDFPVLVEDARATTTGVIISGLNELALDRILFFEGDEYRLQDIDVQSESGQTVACQYFTDTAVYDVRDTPWDFDAWQMREKADFLIRTRNFMTLYGRMSATDADAFW